MDDEIDLDMMFEDDLFREFPNFCLCGRDPACASVQLDIAKTIILRLRYGIVMDGCLEEIADVFDALCADLRPKVARELKQIVREVNSDLSEFAAELLALEGSEPESTRIQ